ncbi:MAG: lysophospholipid acyltransferase family protein, partial [Candidatus Berkiella sp.]
IYIANHASYLDAVVLISLLPIGVKFVAKKELMKVPLLSVILKKLNMITVDRIDFVANINDTDIIANTLKSGGSVGIFPEGTFTYATGLRPFKMGAFKVAAQTLTPICPIAIKGTRNILRDDEFIFSPGIITVTIGEQLIPQSTDWSESINLHKLARDMIAQHCGEPIIDY